LPDHVEKGCARDEDDSDAHGLEIVETVYEADWVTTVAELSLAIVRLEGGAKEVIVSRVTVCKLVKKDSIDGESTPILRRRSVRGILTRSVVVERRRGVLVDVEIPVYEVLTPWGGQDEEREEEEREEVHGRKRKG